MESPTTASNVPSTLIIPRAQFDAVLHRAFAMGRDALPPATVLAHGRLVLPTGGLSGRALAGRLAIGAPRVVAAASAEAGSPDDGLVLVQVAADGAPMPQGDEGWDGWLLQAAPSFRMASASPDPALVVLWLRLDGQGALLFRHGRHDARRARRWHAMEELQLPGGGMSRVRFSAAAVPARPVAVEAAVAGQPPGPAPRFACQHQALGAQTWAHLQGSHVALVGAGRVGSVFAHGLVRMGVQRLTVIEPDVMEPHNEDADLAPGHQGRPKLEALSHFVRGLQRPGAVLDARLLPVASAAAGRLLAQVDLVVACVDNDAARLWANAWALAHNRCLLAIATQVHQRGAEADLRLIPAGAGCLACLGGLVQAPELLAQLALPGPVPTPANRREQREGSLRSWSAMAAHMGLRMFEQHLAAAGGGTLFRQLRETESGALQKRDWRPPVHLHHAPATPACPFCSALQGAGHRAVTAERLRALTTLWLAGGRARSP